MPERLWCMCPHLAFNAAVGMEMQMVLPIVCKLCSRGIRITEPLMVTVGCIRVNVRGESVVFCVCSVGDSSHECIHHNALVDTCPIMH